MAVRFGADRPVVCQAAGSALLLHTQKNPLISFPCRHFMLLHVPSVKALAPQLPGCDRLSSAPLPNSSLAAATTGWALANDARLCSVQRSCSSKGQAAAANMHQPDRGVVPLTAGRTGQQQLHLGCTGIRDARRISDQQAGLGSTCSCGNNPSTPVAAP
jgi:hypothetical protein